jgi:hypothetical protein
VNEQLGIESGGARRAKRGSRALVVAVFLTAGLALQGCQAASEPPLPSSDVSTSRSDPPADGPPAEEVAERIGFDGSASSLTPVYALVPEYRDPMEGFARDLLAAECLDGVVEYRAVEPVSTEVFDVRTGQGLFNLSVAERWGYPHLRSWEVEDSAVPDSVMITDQIFDEMVACGEAADLRLGQAPETFLRSVESAGWQALDESDDMRSAESEWRLCMEPTAIEDLPASPLAMPSESVVPESSYLHGGTFVGSPSPTELERRVAVQDATCRDLVGFDDVMLSVRVQGELEHIGDHIDSFFTSLSDYERYGEGIDQVLRDLG